jgi:ferredoxin-NADP reductase
VRAVLLESREIGTDIRHFVFQVPDVDRVVFVPGQFVSMSAEIAGRKITRAYSICSAPDGNQFELCLNRVQEGMFSPYLFDLRPGDSVNLTPPLGYFTPRNPFNDSLLVATGTGIAPFRSMLLYLLPREPERRITLLFGVRFEHNLLYGEEFEELAQRHANFRFWPTLSRPDSNWRGRSGHVQVHLDEALDGGRDQDVYICGLKAMVDDVRARLKGMGFDRRRILYEKYD